MHYQKFEYRSAYNSFIFNYKNQGLILIPIKIIELSKFESFTFGKALHSESVMYRAIINKSLPEIFTETYPFPILPACRFVKKNFLKSISKFLPD